MTTFVKHKMCNIVSGSGKECDKPMGHKGMCINKTGCLITKWEKTEQSRFMVVDIYCYVNCEWMQMHNIEYDNKDTINYYCLSSVQWKDYTSGLKVFHSSDM